MKEEIFLDNLMHNKEYQKQYFAPLQLEDIEGDLIHTFEAKKLETQLEFRNTKSPKFADELKTQITDIKYRI